MEKKVLSTKIFTIKVKILEDGTHRMQRINDGFEPLELMGIANLVSLEVSKQITGDIKPDVIKREVIIG